MTLQIAMMTCDGWIVASDACAYEQVPVQVDKLKAGTGAGTSTSKIEHCPRGRLLYCFGGNYAAREAGIILKERAIEKIDPSEREALLRGVNAECNRRQAEIGKSISSGRLIVVFYDPQPELWSL